MTRITKTSPFYDYHPHQDVNTTASPYFNKVAIGAAAPADYNVYFYKSLLDTTVSHTGLYHYLRKTSGASDVDADLNGFINYSIFSQVGGTIGKQYGFLNNTFITDGTQGSATDSLYGIYNQVDLTQGTNITTGGDIYGIYDFVDLNSATSITGDIYGLSVDVDIESATTSITGNIFGHHINIDVDRDPTGNVFGCYLSTNSNVDYGYYQAGSSTLNRFDSPLVIRNTAPYFGLTLNDTTVAASQSFGNLFWQSVDADATGNIGAIRVTAVNAFSAGDARTFMSFHTNTGVAGTLGEVMRLSDTANVGIGTTAPGEKLHVASATNPTIRVENTTSTGTHTAGTYGNFSFYTGDATGIGAHEVAAIKWINTLTAASPDGQLAFYTSPYNTAAAERLRIDAAGNVGIGTTAPTAVLHLKAGTATASTAPLKFTAGTDLATPEAGAVEYSTNLLKLKADSFGIISDTYKQYFGAGSDMTVWYDGTVGNIKTSDVAASDLKISCGTDKTLVLDESVYNDANVGGLVLRTGGTAPGVVQWLDNDGDATGIYTIGFDINEQGSSSIEIPHDYKEGTNLVFHIHYGLNDAPTGTDQIRFDLIYNVQRDGTTFIDATTIDSADVAVDTQYKTGRIDFTAITGTNFKIGDQFNFTVKRTTAVGDAFAGEVLTQTLGFHYECDTLGSRQIGTK